MNIHTTGCLQQAHTHRHKQTWIQIHATLLCRRTRSDTKQHTNTKNGNDTVPACVCSDHTAISNLRLEEVQVVPPSLPDVVELASSSDSCDVTSITISSSSKPSTARARFPERQGRWLGVEGEREDPGDCPEGKESMSEYLGTGE